jgi:O-antigen ligase
MNSDLKLNDQSLKVLIWLIFCFISLLMSYYLTLSPKVILGVVVFAFVLLFFYFFPNRALDIAIIGAFFDEIDFNMGFAKLGLGDLGLFVLLGIWLTQNLFTPFPSRSISRLPKGGILLILYLFLMAINMHLGPSYSGLYGRYFRLVAYIFGVFVIVDSIRDLSTLKRCLSLIIFAGFVNAIAAFIMGSSSGHRFEGLAYQSNILAFTIGVALILMFGFLMQGKSILLMLCLIVSSLTAFLLAGSRGATIAMMIAIFWYYKSHWRGFFVAMIILAGGIGLTAKIAPEQFDVLSQRFSFAANDGSVAERQRILSYRLGLIAKYPFFGQGFDQLDLSRHADKNTNIAHKGSHNSYVGLASSNGLVPTLTLFAFILLQVRQMWRLQAKLSQNVATPSTTQDNNTQSNTPYGEGQSTSAQLLMILNFLQMLLIFQSFSLLFRGICRMLDWTPLALYCAIVMLIEEYLQDKTQEIPKAHHHTSSSLKAELA